MRPLLSCYPFQWRHNEFLGNHPKTTIAIAPAIAKATGLFVAIAALELTCGGADALLVGTTILVVFGFGVTLEIKDEGSGGMKVLGLGVTTVGAGGAVVGMVEITTGGRVVTGAGAVTVDFVITEMGVQYVEPGEVAVFSDGTVITSVTGTEVARVMGIFTVAFVVGGSSVFVIVQAWVTW